MEKYFNSSKIKLGKYFSKTKKTNIDKQCIDILYIPMITFTSFSKIGPYQNTFFQIFLYLQKRVCG